eukprot:PhF_6_TR44272/c0_g1_i1/m.68212
MDATSKNVIHPGGPIPTVKTDIHKIRVYGKRYPSYWFTDFITRYPTSATVGALFPVLVLAILGLMQSTSYDLSEDGFEIKNHEVVRSRIAMKNAETEWKERRDSLFTSLYESDTQKYPRTKIHSRQYIQYRIDVTKTTGAVDKSLFNETHLSWIRDFEYDLQNIDGYSTVCWSNAMKEGTHNVDTMQQCSPLGSLMTYFYPGPLLNYSKAGPFWAMRGTSSFLQVPVSKVVDILFTNPNYQWFVDPGFSSLQKSSLLLRTQITQGYPMQDADGNTIDSSTYDLYYSKFMRQLISFIRKRGTPNYLEVTLGGDNVFEALVDGELERTFFFPVISLVIVFLLFWRFMHSVVLALLGVMQIIVTFMAAGYLSVESQNTGGRGVSLLSALSLYVTIAVTCDGVFVFFNTFRHSGIMATSGRMNTLTVSQRLAFTYRKAGVGIVVSNCVSIAAFGSNTVSLIPAIQSFSINMVWIMVVNIYMFLTYFPACVLFHHFTFSGRRRNRQRQREILLRSGYWKREEIFEDYLAQLSKHRQQTGLVPYTILENDMAAKYKYEMELRAAKFGPDVVHMPAWKLRWLALWRTQREIPPPPPSQIEDTQMTLADFQNAAESTSVHRRRPNQNAILRVPQLFTTRDQLATEAIRVALNTTPYNLEGEQADRQQQQLMVRYNTEGMVDFSGGQNVSIQNSELRMQPEKYERLGSVIGIEALHGGLEADGSSTVARMRLPILTYAVVQSVQGVLNIAERRGTTERTVAPMPQAPQPAQSRFSLSGWWEKRRSVRRKWCFGLFGKRAGESQAEKDLRIMTKKGET